MGNIKLLSSLPTSLSIFIISLLVSIGVILPFQIAEFYSTTFKPCGDTWAALWCTFPLAMLATLIAFLISLTGFGFMLAFLKKRGVENILLIFITSALFIIVMTDFFPFILVMESKLFFFMPLVFVIHYFIFTSIKGKKFNIRPAFLSMLIWMVVFLISYWIKLNFFPDITT